MPTGLNRFFGMLLMFATVGVVAWQSLFFVFN